LEAAEIVEEDLSGVQEEGEEAKVPDHGGKRVIKPIMKLKEPEDVFADLDDKLTIEQAKGIFLTNLEAYTSEEGFAVVYVSSGKFDNSAAAQAEIADLRNENVPITFMPRSLNKHLERPYILTSIPALIILKNGEVQDIKYGNLTELDVKEIYRLATDPFASELGEPNETIIEEKMAEETNFNIVSTSAEYNEKGKQASHAKPVLVVQYSQDNPEYEAVLSLLKEFARSTTVFSVIAANVSGVDLDRLNFKPRESFKANVWVDGKSSEAKLGTPINVAIIEETANALLKDVNETVVASPEDVVAEKTAETAGLVVAEKTLLNRAKAGFASLIEKPLVDRVVENEQIANVLAKFGEARDKLNASLQPSGEANRWWNRGADHSKTPLLGKAKTGDTSAEEPAEASAVKRIKYIELDQLRSKPIDAIRGSKPIQIILGFVTAGMVGVLGFVGLGMKDDKEPAAKAKPPISDAAVLAIAPTPKPEILKVAEPTPDFSGAIKVEGMANKDARTIYYIEKDGVAEGTKPGDITKLVMFSNAQPPEYSKIDFKEYLAAVSGAKKAGANDDARRMFAEAAMKGALTTEQLELAKEWFTKNKDLFPSKEKVAPNANSR
jgi:hypothetical protein